MSTVARVGVRQLMTSAVRRSGDHHDHGGIPGQVLTQE